MINIDTLDMSRFRTLRNVPSNTLAIFFETLYYPIQDCTYYTYYHSRTSVRKATVDVARIPFSGFRAFHDSPGSPL